MTGLTGAARSLRGLLLSRNAGVLFFARDVRHFFSQAYITRLLAKGTDKVHILDRKDFDGGIVADIEDAMRFIGQFGTSPNTPARQRFFGCSGSPGLTTCPHSAGLCGAPGAGDRKA